MYTLSGDDQNRSECRSAQRTAATLGLVGLAIHWKQTVSSIAVSAVVEEEINTKSLIDKQNRRSKIEELIRS